MTLPELGSLVALFSECPCTPEAAHDTAQIHEPHCVYSECPTSQKLPLTLPELVSSSPSMTDDGSIVLGMRANNVFMLDMATGQLLRMLTGLAGTVDPEAEELQGGMH
eukprot:scaffold81570_cov17-Tisochrysis_lutea.AAC.1